MANSLSFNGTDLSAYGLYVLTRDIPVQQQIDAAQLQDRAYADRSKVITKPISLAMEITGADAATLKANVDAVRRILNIQTDGQLILDMQSDRYWLARFEKLTGNYMYRVFEGTLDFICYDPYAYDVEEEDNDHLVDGSPETVLETTGGTARIEPVYNLTADAPLPATTVGILNVDTGMILEWTGDLVATDVLIIDCQLWLVKLNGVASMATVGGQFPYLLPGQENELSITGFHGNLNITYRNRYV